MPSILTAGLARNVFWKAADLDRGIFREHLFNPAPLSALAGCRALRGLPEDSDSLSPMLDVTGYAFTSASRFKTLW
jgi:hypothetical protein